MRKLALMVESVYNALNLLFTWFALANFYIFFVSQLVYLSTNQDR
jgi:chitin synthase